MRPSLFIIVPALAFSNSEPEVSQEPEPEMKLSDEDEALIKHTLRTLTFITLDTNSDVDETRLLFLGESSEGNTLSNHKIPKKCCNLNPNFRPLKPEVSEKELEEMKLSSEEFSSFLSEVNQNLNSEDFKIKAREKSDFADALSELIVRLLPKRNLKDDHENDFAKTESEKNHDTNYEIDFDNEDFYDDVEPDFIPFFESIDHLSENTFLDDPKCPETWIYNDKQECHQQDHARKPISTLLSTFSKA